jgi:DNA-binding transcriptional ArsR family regulator
MSAEARFFKYLADETRLKIIRLLSGAEDICICDVIDTLGITQSKASRRSRCAKSLNDHGGRSPSRLPET